MTRPAALLIPFRILVFGVLAAFSTTEAISATGPKITHAYGSDPQHILDTYSPPGSGHPILIYAHGGSWHSGSKDNRVTNKKEGLVGSLDYVLVSVEYRSGYDTNWQGQANDIRDAINWVYFNATSFGGSKENIFVLGHSSGAHMTALVSMDDSFGIREIAKGIVLLDSGDYDVVDGYNNCSGQSCAKYGEFWDDYNLISMENGSPIYHADDNTAAPTIIIHRNTGFKIGQANVLNSAIHSGGQTTVEQYGSNDSHEDINVNIGAAGFSYTTQVSDFLETLVDFSSIGPGC